MRKNMLCGVLALMMVGVLGGCSATSPEAKIRAETTAFTAEEVKANQLSVMTSEEKESLVYSYISSAVQVDTSKLLAVEQKDATALRQRVVDMNKGLATGVLKEIDDKGVVKFDCGITDSFANYMLWHFSKTPYTWSMSDCRVVGMDAATHLYFVDVTYKTTSTKKKVLPDSKIVMGQPDETYIKQQRYRDYLTYVDSYRTNYLARDNMLQNSSEAKLNELIAKDKKAFEDKWGNIDELIKAQKADTPIERAKANNANAIGAFAYPYQTDDMFSGSGEMKYRVVFGYSYNLGEAVDLGVKAVYLMSYTNSRDGVVDGLKSEVNAEEILTPLVRRTINSFMLAEDECNHRGLYSLLSDAVYEDDKDEDDAESLVYPYYKNQTGYEKYDTYFDDYDKYTYHKNGSYLFNILGRKDDLLYVKVTLNLDERAKGSSMSQPSYKEDLLFTLKLRSNDTMGVQSIGVMGMTLVGEPLSVISKVSGVSDQLLFTEGEFTTANKQKVEEVIKNFMRLELTQNFDSEVFSNCIDIGISNTQLENIRTNLNAVKADEIITWQTEYTVESNMYVSVNLREVFINNTTRGKNEVESILELVNRSGKWFVVSYTRMMNATLKGSTVADDNCLEHFIMKDGKIVSVKKNLLTKENEQALNESSGN